MEGRERGEIDTLLAASRDLTDLGDVSGAIGALSRASLAHYYLSDARIPLELALRMERCELSPRDKARLYAAQARLVARLPLERDVADTSFDILPCWLPREEESHELATRARAIPIDPEDATTRDIIDGAWRSVHRSPAFRGDAWQPRRGDPVRITSAMEDPLTLDIAIDRLLWDAVDALECGYRFEYDRLIQEARALAAVGTLDYLQWWIRSCMVTRALNEGLPIDAMALADEAAAFARERGILGGPSVLSLQRWYLDELRDDHSFGVEVGLTARRRIDHPLTAACPALSLARAGLISLAAPWAEWLAHYLSDGSQESSWLALITISADLARLLVEAEHTSGEQLAASVMPHLDRYRHRMAIDTRAVLSLGAVARAGADLALARGDLDTAAERVNDATRLLERMGNPIIPRIELTLAQSRLALARHEDASPSLSLAMSLSGITGLERLRREAEDLVSEASLVSAPQVLTAREVQVLALLAQGRSNPEIAAELAYSRATIAKDVRRLYVKLAARTREELMRRGVELSG